MQNYELSEIFWSVQGEGFYSGVKALFIRLPNCNLKCKWCDTNWKIIQNYPEYKLKDICKQEIAPLCIITGGEPLFNPQIEDIIKILYPFGFKINCETNGTMPYINGIDWITCSPKKESAYIIHPDIEKRVNEFKYVVDKDFDFSILKRHNIEDGRYYYLSPEFGSFRKSIKAILDFQKNNIFWRISLQTHKWMKIK